MFTKSRTEHCCVPWMHPAQCVPVTDKGERAERNTFKNIFISLLLPFKLLRRKGWKEHARKHFYFNFAATPFKLCHRMVFLQILENLCCYWLHNFLDASLPPVSQSARSGGQLGSNLLAQNLKGLLLLPRFCELVCLTFWWSLDEVTLKVMSIKIWKACSQKWERNVAFGKRSSA